MDAKGSGEEKEVDVESVPETGKQKVLESCHT